jgi:hypothetical protein
MSWEEYQEKMNSLDLFLWQQSVFRNEMKV